MTARTAMTSAIAFAGCAAPAAMIPTSMRLLLSSYGIAVIEVNSLTRIVPDSTNPGYLPEIHRGRALPETLLPMQPIF